MSMRRKTASVFEDAKAYRQQVRMASVQVAGLSSEELHQALAYEVEPASGIPAAMAELDYRPVADADATVRVYEVAVRIRTGATGAGHPSSRWLTAAGVLGVFILLAGGADCYLLNARLNELKSQFAIRSVLDAKVKSVDAKARTQREAAQKLRADRAAAVRAQDEAAKLRNAYRELLQVLADAAGDKAVVSALGSPAPFVMKVSGASSSANDAAEAMAAMTAAAAKIGWHFRPGRIETSQRGMTASFEGEVRRD